MRNPIKYPITAGEVLDVLENNRPKEIRNLEKFGIEDIQVGSTSGLISNYLYAYFAEDEKHMADFLDFCKAGIAGKHSLKE